MYVYLGGAVLFRKDTGSATAHFYASDLSDNVRVVLSYSGSVSVELKQRYKPFGQMAAPLVSPPTLNPSHRFSDLPTTTTTGLTTMGARHYAPDLGRFLSRDPLGFHDHSYAGDNPLSFRDPSGLDATQALRDEILPDYVDYVQPLTIEGVPEVSVSSLTFDVEGNFYGEAVGAIAEVPAASVSEPGELTPVEGVPLSEVAAEATAYGWEPGVTPTAAGQAAETAPAPAAPSGLSWPASSEPAQPGEGIVRVRHYTSAESAELIQRSGHVRASSYVALQEQIPAGTTQSEVTRLLELPGGHAEMYVDLEVPGSQLAIPPNGPVTSGGLWQRILVSNFPIGNAQFQPVAP